MRSNLVYFYIMLISISGCSVDDSNKSNSNYFPKKSATHTVTLYKVQTGFQDFWRSAFGNPLDYKVIIRENGIEIKPLGRNLIKGDRGERYLDNPVLWNVSFDVKKNYQIVLEEQSLISERKSWYLPATPKIGYWPIGGPKGKITFGKESYLQFRDEVVE